MKFTSELINKRLLFFVVFIIAASKIHSQNITITRLNIKYVAFNILTLNDISCDDFEKSFDERQLKDTTINDSAILFSFEKILKGIRYKKIKNTAINVRAKFYLYYNNRAFPVILCVNTHYDVLVNNRLIRKNNQLLEMVRGCLKM